MALNTETSLSRNPNVPAMGQPLADLQSLVSIATQLKQGVESLGGQRGNMLDRAVTLRDLVALNLTTVDIIRAVLS